MRNSPCRPIGETRPFVCAFGASAATATATVAIIGDSHAVHWRAAVTEIARTTGWRGLNIGHSSCPLQLAMRDLPEPRRTSCAEWKRHVLEWLPAHPEVHTVFVGGLTGGTGVVPAPGQDRFAAAVDAYAAAWAALPATVRQIVVIRDTPKFRHNTDTCIERALRRRRRPDLACARPRKRALEPDPAVAAAARMPPERVRVADLTRFFCDARLCYPVVGGALVLRDNTHLTGVFSATLGPYLLRAAESARSWLAVARPEALFS